MVQSESAETGSGLSTEVVVNCSPDSANHVSSICIKSLSILH